MVLHKFRHGLISGSESTAGRLGPRELPQILGILESRDLGDEDDPVEMKRNIIKDISKRSLGPRELAKLFDRGSEIEKQAYAEYVAGKPPLFRSEFYNYFD